MYEVYSRVSQRQGQMIHVFCLGGIACIKLSKNSSKIQLHHMSNNNNFPSK